MNTIQEKTSSVNSWEDLFKMSITKTMEKTHVATLAFVESDNGFNSSKKIGSVTCKPFPLLKDQSEYTITAYYLSSESSFAKGDIICVLFTDYDFRTAIQADTPKQCNSTDNHSISYGIILKTA